MDNGIYCDWFAADCEGRIAAFDPGLFEEDLTLAPPRLIEAVADMKALAEYLESRTTHDRSFEPVVDAVYYQLLDGSHGDVRAAGKRYADMIAEGGRQRVTYKASLTDSTYDGLYEYKQFYSPTLEGDAYCQAVPQHPLRVYRLPYDQTKVFDRFTFKGVSFAELRYFPFALFQRLLA